MRISSSCAQSIFARTVYVTHACGCIANTKFPVSPESNSFISNAILPSTISPFVVYVIPRSGVADTSSTTHETLSSQSFPYVTRQNILLQLILVYMLRSDVVILIGSIISSLGSDSFPVERSSLNSSSGSFVHVADPVFVLLLKSLGRKTVSSSVSLLEEPLPHAHVFDVVISSTVASHAVSAHQSLPSHVRDRSFPVSIGDVGVHARHDVSGVTHGVIVH